MIESGYYPDGAQYDSNAPWNEVIKPDIYVKATISQSLSRDINLCIKEYPTIVEEDEDGWYEYPDYSSINLNEVYKEQHLTPTKLIEEFSKYLNKELKKDNLDSKTKNRLQFLLDECLEWVEDDLEVVKYD